MVDNFICSRRIFLRVKDCKLVNIGMRNYHMDVQTTFKITVNKFKVIEKILSHIYWDLIDNHKITNEIFKNSLSMYVDGSTTYSDFNKYILQAFTATATTNNQKNKVW